MATYEVAVPFYGTLTLVTQADSPGEAVVTMRTLNSANPKIYRSVYVDWDKVDVEEIPEG